jgi:hypothetical protein
VIGSEQTNDNALAKVEFFARKILRLFTAVQHTKHIHKQLTAAENMVLKLFVHYHRHQQLQMGGA